MRRLAALLTTVVAAAAVLLASGFGDPGAEGTYRVDAIFDNAGFVIPGQDVKIAGARVGEITEVSLTEDRKARVAMEVDARYGAWRDDADCTIQPQSLIGEKFIQCTPGTPRGRPLRGDTPTLPVTNTHAPIDADLVFAAFRAPLPDRLRILVAELGAGLAGRSEELSEVIRRANPALKETNRVLRILEDDRARLGSLVTESERVVGALAAERGTVARAITRSARVTGRLARRRSELGATIDRLPGMLAAARPAVEDLRALTDDAAPVLDDLRRSAAPLGLLARRAGPLADAARPALDRLGEAARTGGPVLRRARPLVDDLRVFARAALPTGRLVAQLFGSLRDRGVVEGLQDFVFYAAQATARFDRYSHIIPAHLLGSECSAYATTTVPDCSAHFAGGGTAGAAKAKARTRRSTQTRPAGTRPQPKTARDDAGGSGEGAADRGAGEAPPARPAVPGLDDLPRLPDPAGGGDPGGLDRSAEELLEFLLD